MYIDNGFDQADICDSEGNIITSGYLWSNSGDYIEIRSKSFRLYEQGDKLNVIIQYRNGRKESIFGYVFLSKETYISLFVLCRTRDFEQRSYFRVETNVKAQITGEFVEDKAVNLTKPIDITILNICLGGMLINSTVDLDVDKKYKAAVVFDNNRIDVIFKIARSLQNESDNKYGCMFQDISQRNERIICKYLFDLQIKKRAEFNKLI